MMHSRSLDRRGFVALLVGGALFPTVVQAQTSLITDCRGRSVSVGSASRIEIGRAHV